MEKKPIDDSEERKNNNCVTLVEEEEYIEKASDKRQLPFLCSTQNRIHSPESSTESDEICKILSSGSGIDKKKIHVQEVIEKCVDCEKEKEEEEEKKKNNSNNSENVLIEECEEDCSFVYYEEPSLSIGEEEEESSHGIFNDISFSNCEFDVQTFNKFLNCSDEDKQESSEEGEGEGEGGDDEDTKSDESDFFCDCLVEAVPLYHQTSTSAKDIMRETGASAGKLRSLLKPANRPPPARKNRVVFDETRNEFFDADYIILIREDCPYDEEDEEPCTCGDHELVRICCDEGCNCGYADVDDGRTPPVSKFSTLYTQSSRFHEVEMRGNCSHNY